MSTFLEITMVTVFLILTPRPKDSLFSFIMFSRFCRSQPRVLLQGLCQQHISSCWCCYKGCVSSISQVAGVATRAVSAAYLKLLVLLQGLCRSAAYLKLLTCQPPIFMPGTSATSQMIYIHSPGEKSSR